MMWFPISDVKGKGRPEKNIQNSVAETQKPPTGVFVNRPLSTIIITCIIEFPAAGILESRIETDIGGVNVLLFFLFLNE